jgi:TRAP-type mannitol/chloroaromatic compound transport system permease small subunit
LLADSNTAGILANSLERSKAVGEPKEQRQGLFYKLLSVLSAISCALIFFIAIWMCVDVIGRVAFNHPVPGTPELVKSLLPAIVFLSLAYTLRQDAHVKVELITRGLRGLSAAVAGLLHSFFGMIVFFVVMWNSLAPAWEGWLIREYEGVQLEVPVYPVRFIVFFGAGLLCLQYLLNFVEDIKVIRNMRKIRNSS